MASVLALAGWAGATAPIVTAAPVTGSQDAVAWFSDPRDLLGGQDDSDTHLWRGTDTPITLARAGDGVVVTVGTDDTRSFHRFELQPPPGTALAPGAYPDAGGPGYQRPGEPALQIRASDVSCGGTSEFEVRDIAWDGSGEPTRLWAVYAQGCGTSGGPAHWGEIRLGEPETADPIVVPSVVRWPEVDLGTPHRTVPVTVIAGTSATDVDGAALRGDGQAGDFAVANDGCANARLAAGATCAVQVGFTPSVSGTRATTLGIATSAGPLTAALQGWTYGGVTRLHVTGDAGDWITQGNTYDYTPANARIVVNGGSAHGMWLGIGDGNGSDTWDVQVAAPRGQDLQAPFTYNDADDLDEDVPGLQVGGPGRGCVGGANGRFIMNSLVFGPESLAPAQVSVSFDQHCQAGSWDGWSHGTFQFRDGDRTTPAPWMAADAVPGAPAATDGGGATTTTTTTPATPGPPPVAGTSAPVGRTPAVSRTAARPSLRFLGLVGKGRRTLRLSTRLPRAGTLTARVTVRLHGRTLLLGDGRATSSRAATKTMNIGLRRSVLKALARVRSTRMTATVTWRPKGARSIRSKATGVLKLRR
jgi:hypothetical protein